MSQHGQRNQRAKQPDRRANSGLLVALVERVFPPRPPRAQPQHAERQAQRGQPGQGDHPGSDIGRKTTKKADNPSPVARSQKPSGLLCRRAPALSHLCVHAPRQPAKRYGRGQRRHAQKRPDNQVAQQPDQPHRQPNDHGKGGRGRHVRISDRTSPSDRAARNPISAAMVGAMADWSTVLSSTRPRSIPGPKTTAHVSCAMRELKWCWNGTPISGLSSRPQSGVITNTVLSR